jgi:putative nucleotidyltransferase with HDIG domain
LSKFMSELQRNISPIYLLGTVKSFHEYTYTHLINVGILTMSLAGEMGFNGSQLLEVGIAALLHDVGKSFIPDEILNKTGVLSQEERAIIETHSLRGGLHLMKLVGIPKIVILSAIEHHQKYDGTGYPFIKPGWKPNIVAQMISITDVFDALRSRRSYNEPKTLKVIEDILRKEKGTTFNPVLVDMFIKMINPEDPQSVEESHNSPILIAMNSSGSGQSDLTLESPQLSEIPIEKTTDQILDAGNHPKEDTIMDNNLRLEQLVDQHIAENRIDAAVSTLYRLIVTYAKEKNFVKAELLREKLYEIDSMALNEIVSSAEIIEQEKQKGMTQDHQELWTDLYRTLGKEEGTCLYYSMKEASYSSDQPLFTQGEDNSNLYFVMQGQLKMLCSHNKQEVLLKQLNPGDVLGIDTFFYDSVCTTTVSPFSRVKVNYLEKSVLKEWKEKFPALESKLYRYCLKFEKSHDLLKKKGLDRRAQKRFRIEGNASIQILSSSGASVGKPFRGVIYDISASGTACIIKLVKKEIAQLLLGRRMELKLIIAVKGGSRTISQIGTVVAVSSPPFDDYYLHFKFHQLLDSNLIREIAAIQTPGAN